MRWSEEQYMEWLEKQGHETARKKPKKRSKYNNKKTWVDGICFDSKKEADYYSMLKVLKEAGEIKGFCRQPEFILVEGNVENRAITYKADFIVFHNDGRIEIIDVKGYESDQWKRTYKQFKLKYPNMELKIVKEGI